LGRPFWEMTAATSHANAKSGPAFSDHIDDNPYLVDDFGESKRLYICDVMFYIATALVSLGRTFRDAISLESFPEALDGGPFPLAAYKQFVGVG
jgi:hypothetical protein